MDGGQLTAIFIVAIVMIGSIFRAKESADRDGTNGDDQTGAENQRLREEVGQLKERLKVLERITVDKENSLSREIELLRDR